MSGEKEKLGVMEGGGENNPLETLRVLNDFLRQYTGYHPEKRSRWRVQGKDENGLEILFRVKFCEEDEFTAKKIAQLINQLGGKAEVKKGD